MMRLRSIAFATTMMASLSATPLFAQAPAPSMPNGACGPGTIPAPGGGCMMIPQNTGTAPQVPSGPRPTAWTDNYTAIVWGFDAKGDPQFTFSTYNNQEWIAGKFAMDDCVAKGLNECQMGGTYVNQSIAIARSNDGALYSRPGAKPGDAKTAVKAACEEKSGGKCKVLKVINGQPWKYYTDR